MTKEEEKLYLRESMYDFIEASRIEMEAVSAKCLMLYPKSIEFVKQSSKFGGYFSAKTWLYNNSDCESIDDLKRRIKAFEEILNHPKNLLVEQYMEGSCCTEVDPFDREKCLEILQKCGVNLKETSPVHIQSAGYSLFQQGIKLIEELLRDEDIKKREDICNFQLYSGKLQQDWTGVGFYQIIGANHECLQLLKSFYDSVARKGSESVVQK